jgi:Protein of unknown function (DUF2637)
MIEPRRSVDHRSAKTGRKQGPDTWTTLRAHLRRWQWGMYGVGLAAAVLSFDQLWRLALACGWPPSIAWMLAVIVDAYAIDATRRWLRAGIDKDLRRWAGLLVWACVGVSLAGNTIEHALTMGYLTMRDGRPEWWIVVIVGTVPTIMLASLIHLEAMARSPRAEASADTGGSESAETTKRGRLLVLLESVPPDESESNYKVGQRLGPAVGLNVQTASRYVREWREARATVAKLGPGQEAAS